MALLATAARALMNASPFLTPVEICDRQLSKSSATLIGVIHPRERVILNRFRAMAAKMIGEWDGYGIVSDDNTFRGPGLSSYIMSTRIDGNDVMLRIQRRDKPWLREIRVAPTNSWGESTKGGPVEHSSANFPAQQQVVITRLFEDVKVMGG